MTWTFEGEGGVLIMRLFDRKMHLVANLTGPSNGYILLQFIIIVIYQFHSSSDNSN